MPGGKYAGLENFFISDSIPKHSDLLVNCPPFRVLSLAPTLFSELSTRHGLLSSKVVFRVYLASENPHKLIATKHALRNTLPGKFELHAIHCSSEINEQPIGLENTIFGARNRLRNIRIGRSRVFDENNGIYYRIAIESGIDPETLEDFAVVLVERDGKEIMEISERTKVDQEIWEYFQSRSEDEFDMCCGSVYNKLKGFDKSDWHVDVSGRSRAYLLKNAIVKALQRI